MVIKRGIRTSKKKAQAKKKRSGAKASHRQAVRRTPPSSPIHRIAICTGGGDAPGLNAVIRAAVLGAYNQGWEVVGIREGYLGLLEPRDFPEGGTIRLTPESVRGITHLGGTILGSTNKGNPLDYPMPRADGTVGSVDRGDELIGRFNALGIDALVSVGGDGSLTIANELAKRGVRVVGVAEDDRQRPRQDRDDFRLRLGGELCHRLYRSPALHGRGAPAHHGGRGHGAVRRLDRA